MWSKWYEIYLVLASHRKRRVTANPRFTFPHFPSPAFVPFPLASSIYSLCRWIWCDLSKAVQIFRPYKHIYHVGLALLCMAKNQIMRHGTRYGPHIPPMHTHPRIARVAHKKKITWHPMPKLNGKAKATCQSHPKPQQLTGMLTLRWHVYSGVKLSELAHTPLQTSLKLWRVAICDNVNWGLWG